MVWPGRGVGRRIPPHERFEPNTGPTAPPRPLMTPATGGRRLRFWAEDSAPGTMYEEFLLDLIPSSTASVASVRGTGSGSALRAGAKASPWELFGVHPAAVSDATGHG